MGWCYCFLSDGVAVRSGECGGKFAVRSGIRKKNELELAIAQYRQTIDLQPEYVKNYQALGKLQHQRGHLDEAIACYQQVIEHCPESHVWIYKRLGEATNEQARQLEKGSGYDKQRIAKYRQEVEREPESFWLRYLLGEALAKVGHMEAAAASFRETIRLNPDFLKPYYQLWEMEPNTAASRALLQEAWKRQSQVNEAILLPV